MREDNCVDVNDLILKPLLAFERDPKMARAWARQFDAIMVDEYQDTNKGQYRLMRVLTEGKDNVLLLGDDDQLIFAGRGVDSSYVVDFEPPRPKGQAANMKMNYRPQLEVPARATSMIDLSFSRLPQEMSLVQHRPAVRNTPTSVHTVK